MPPMPSHPSRTPATRYRNGVPEAKQHGYADTMDPVIESSEQHAGDYRLLIVDDDIHLRTVASAMAACLGYRTHTAANGEEALQILRNEEVDLVITDYQMPLMNGFQLASEIRHQYADLPVILMTGRTNVALMDRQQGRKLFTGLLNKPFSRQELGEMIDMAVVPPRESLAV